MNKDETTSDLLNRRFKAATLKDFLGEEPPQLPLFHEYVAQLCENRGRTREYVIRRAGIERTYGHRLFNGTRKPSRDKTIQIAFGLGLDLEETQQLLRVAEKSALYPRIKRDAAIIYCIGHHMEVDGVQEVLARFELQALGG